MDGLNEQNMARYKHVPSIFIVSVVALINLPERKNLTTSTDCKIWVTFRYGHLHMKNHAKIQVNDSHGSP